MKDIEHKKWTITYNPKPILLRTNDYDVVHNDYDGPEDDRCFTAASIDDAISTIDEIEEGILKIGDA